MAVTALRLQYFDLLLDVRVFQRSQIDDRIYGLFFLFMTQVFFINHSKFDMIQCSLILPFVFIKNTN